MLLMLYCFDLFFYVCNVVGFEKLFSIILAAQWEHKKKSKSNSFVKLKKKNIRLFVELKSVKWNRRYITYRRKRYLVTLVIRWKGDWFIFFTVSQPIHLLKVHHVGTENKQSEMERNETKRMIELTSFSSLLLKNTLFIH